MIKSIYEYCLSVGIDVLYISYENSLETDLIKSACRNKKIILFVGEKNAGKDLDIADWHAQQAAYEEQRIADLERKLGK